MYVYIDAPAVMAAVLGAALFVARYARTAAAEARMARAIPFRALGWYHPDSVAGTSSPRFREFMASHNRLTAAMWLCLLLSAAIYITGHALVPRS